MAYSKQSWVNNDSGTPISATRLNHVEDGIEAVHNKADGLASVASTGQYNDLLGKPSLALVATSGSYVDIANKPTISTVGQTGEYTDLLNKPALSQVATTGSYISLTDQP